MTTRRDRVRRFMKNKSLEIVAALMIGAAAALAFVCFVLLILSMNWLLGG